MLNDLGKQRASETLALEDTWPRGEHREHSVIIEKWGILSIEKWGFLSIEK